MLKVTLKKSPIGYSIKHKRTVEALGLRRLNSSITLPDTPTVRGMIRKVDFLLEVQMVPNGEDGQSNATT